MIIIMSKANDDNDNGIGCVLFFAILMIIIGSLFVWGPVSLIWIGVAIILIYLFFG
jgi:hypothetical protein